MDPLVSPQWLIENLGTEKLVDGSWRMPGNPHARNDFDQGHIRGAVFFDIDAVADQTTELPHMLPSPERFAEAVSEMGISNTDPVIVYDDQGVFSAARVWWTFRAMGHSAVRVLNGGLPAWIALGGAVTNEKTIPKPATYKVPQTPSLVTEHCAVRSAVTDDDSQILDARPPARFEGLAQEPREGLISGAMPGAKNIPYTSLIDDDGWMKSESALKTVFDAAGVRLSSPIITTCGSGVTAAIIALALARLGHQQWSLYDGSWAEWGKETNDRVEYPIIGANE